MDIREIPRNPKAQSAFSLLWLTALALLVYGKSLGNGFTNWDDSIFLAEPAIRDFDLARIFTSSLLSNYYPLTLISLASDYRLGGGDPFFFHLTSLALHLLNAYLVGLLVLQLFDQNRFLALLSSSLFLIHPVHVEAISWTAARNYPLSTAFLLASLLVYHRYVSRNPEASPGWKLYLSVFFLFLLAVLSKPTAVVMPALFLALDRLGKRGNMWSLLREKLPLLALAIPMAAITVRGYSLDSPNSPEIFRLSLVERALWAVKGLFFYLGQFLFPLKLSAYYDSQLVELGPSSLLAIPLMGGLLFAYWKFRFLRSPGATFGLAMFAAALFPALKLIPFGEYSIFNDRYLYFPSIGLLLFLAGMGDALARKSMKLRQALVIAAVLALIPLSGMALAKTRIWESGETLWKDVLAQYPSTAMAHNNLGRVYLERNDWEKALAEFQMARDARPALDKAYFNLGLVAEHFDQADQAAAYYEKALQLNPAYAEAHNNLGHYHSSRSEHEKALRQFLLGIQSGARFKEIFYNVAWSYWRLGKLEECREYLRFTLEIDPDFGPALELSRRTRS